MTAKINELIDTTDNFTIIRDQVASILFVEMENQKVLAAAALEDPTLWDLRIFRERSDPWEVVLNNPENITPVVNVWFESDTFDPSASNVVERQKAEGIINIDIFAGAVSEDDGTGHKPRDREAALNAQRAVTLVRKILMAGTYTYLGLRGIVWRRFPSSRTIFQPQQGDIPIQGVVGARLALSVHYNELSPQVAGEALETVFAEVKRNEDGQLYFEAQYDY